MRPKKQLLLVSANEDTVSTFRLVFTVQGYGVRAVATEAAAAAVLSDFLIDLIVLDGALADDRGVEMACNMKRLKPFIPLILMGDDMDGAPISRADAWVNETTITPAEMLERIKVMSARKRGPRKGSARVYVNPRPSPATLTA